MKLHLLVLASVLALSSAAAEREDAIDALVAKLSASHGLWVNGLSPRVDLPAEASTAQVLDEMFKRVSFDEGKVTAYQILEQRQISIAPNMDQTYTAAHLSTNQGEWIVLLRYEGPGCGWWTRPYRPGQ